MKELIRIAKKLGFKVRKNSSKSKKSEKDTENLINNMTNISHKKMIAPYNI